MSLAVDLLEARIEKLESVVDAARSVTFLVGASGTLSMQNLRQALRDLDEAVIRPAVDFIMRGDEDEKVTAGTQEEIEQGLKNLDKTIESIRDLDEEQPT